MTLLEGRHVSSDVAVVDGAPRWWRHVTGKPAGEGTFDYWIVHAEPDAGIEARCGAWMQQNLAGYTGMLNLETIGGTIIEAHLRFADQWPDLYGPGWVDAVVAPLRDRRMGLCRRRPQRRLQRRAVRAERPALPPSAAGAGRGRQSHPRHHQRADHLPRRSAAGTARHAARRLSPRHRQRLRSARGVGGAGAAERLFLRPSRSWAASV